LAKPKLVGKRVKCPGCGQALAIPSASVETDQQSLRDDSLDVGDNAADLVRTASPPAVSGSEHGQGGSEKSNRRRFVLIGVGSAGVVVVLLLVAAGLGLFRDRPQASGEANSPAGNEKAEVDIRETSPRVSADSTDMKLEIDEAVARQKECSQSSGSPVEITNSIGMKMVLIPPGEFMRRGMQQLGDRASYLKKPQRKVRITKPFYLGMYEVTQAEYEEVMGENPSDFAKGGRCADRVSGKDTSRNPVEMVSWYDAVEFCKRLSAKEGETYRLLTEAEWEYACRAGTTTLYSFGDNKASLGEYAWYDAGIPYSHLKTHPVGEKKPNAWGLHDMHGNIMEWCQDWFAKDYYAVSPTDDPPGPATGRFRVGRGGSFRAYYFDCESSDGCCTYLPTARFIGLGFRVVLGEMSEEAKAAIEEAAADFVIAEISRLGGSVYRDGSAPDKPVIGVQIRSKRVTNTVLERLKLLSRLQTLELKDCVALTDVDGLRQLTGLTGLRLVSCTSLTNLDDLSGLTKLQTLDLALCSALTNVDGLKGLTELQSLTLSGCYTLTIIDALQRLTKLQTLFLGYNPRLTNVDGLKGLTQLETLLLPDCTALTNVDGLLGLTGLKELVLRGCRALTQADRDKLRASLPKTNIQF